MVVPAGVAALYLGRNRVPSAVRSAWRAAIEAKQLVDNANREVDDILKHAWYEFRHGANSGSASVLDTVVVIATLAILLVALTTPATRAILLDLALTVLR